MHFLSLYEQTCLQRLNNFFYCIAVSRVNTRLEFLILGRTMKDMFGDDYYIRSTGFEFNGSNLTTNFMTADRTLPYKEDFFQVHARCNATIKAKGVGINRVAFYSNKKSAYMLSACCKLRPFQARQSPSMASYRSAWVFLIGGYSCQRHRVEGGVEAFSLPAKKWFTDLPELNEARRSASSCVLDDRTMYTFGGVSSIYRTRKEEMVTSIERIKVQALIDWQACKDVWELISVNPRSKVKSFHRYDALIAPVGKTQVMILGGCGKFGQKFNEGIIYDARTNRATEMTLGNFELGQGFDDFDLMDVGRNQKVSIVKDDKYGVLHIVTYSQSSWANKDFKMHWHC